MGHIVGPDSVTTQRLQCLVMGEPTTSICDNNAGRVAMNPSLKQHLDEARASVGITETMCVEAVDGLRKVLRCESIEDARAAALATLIRVGHCSMTSSEIAESLRVPQAWVDLALLERSDESG